MPKSLTEHAFDRESAVLLRRLSAAKGFLLPDADGAWQLYSYRNRYERPLARIEAPLVEAMKDRRLLVAGRSGGLEPGADAQGPRRNDDEWPLGRLARRHDRAGNPLISPEQLEAAERLRRDYTVAKLDPRVTSNWDISAPVGQGAPGREDELSGRAYAARRRVHAAFEAVGHDLSALLNEVCCLSAGMEQAERRIGLPRRSGRPLLQLALGRLARHYDAPQSEQRGQRHWGAPGYRPAIGS